MENVYITLAEATKPSDFVSRCFPRDIVDRTFDSIIDTIISHKGDDINNPYSADETDQLNSLSQAYKKGKSKGTLDVSYISATDDIPKDTSLLEKASTYPDFLAKDSDFFANGSLEYDKGCILIKNNTTGGI